ncbi:MAG TPA: hypothetical protein VKA31_11270 [Mariprofundaceae bacterium]|nr:hypothetical protein [Mariprofundaceae bacterium]
MGLNANNVPFTGGGNTPPMDSGTYPARLVQVIDLGLQAQRPYQGQDKPPAREIALTYEFPTVFMQDEDGQDLEDKPRWLTELIPLHNLKSDRARSTKRYKALDPKGEAAGDFAVLVNTPVMVNVVQNPGKGANKGKVYENINEVMPFPKGMTVGELANSPRVFDLDAPDVEVFMALPKFIQEKITSNLEFEGSGLQALIKDAKVSQPSKDDATPSKTEADDDENPF